MTENKDKTRIKIKITIKITTGVKNKKITNKLTK